MRHERRHADRRARRDRRPTSAARSSATRTRRARRSTWGIHTHNDAELAVANSMAAVAAGVRHVQATINGYGERAGNANMVSILANLALKTPHELVPAGGGALDRAHRAQPIGRRDRQPEARTTGSRTSAGRRSPTRAASTAPPSPRSSGATSTSTRRAVGNVGRLVVSELGGRANTRIRAEQLGHQLEGVDRPEGPRASSSSSSSREGLAFEGAEASFELLIRRHQAGLRRAVPDRRLHLPRRAARRVASSSPRRPSRSRSTARSSTPPPTATAR